MRIDKHNWEKAYTNENKHIYARINANKKVWTQLWTENKHKYMRININEY